MHRLEKTVVATCVLITAAIALSALTGAAAAQSTQIDSCTTIDEPGEYEFAPTFDATATGNATNVTETNETVDDATDANVTDAESTGVNETDRNETGANDTEANRTGACILITASDVVLEGNDTVLDGSNLSAANITETNETDANGTDGEAPDQTVTEIGDTSENASTGANATAENASELTGIEVRPAPGENEVTNVTIRNLTVQNWYLGVSLRGVTDANLDGVRLRNNTEPGIRLSDAYNASLASETEAAD